ncbi:hypothetical protein CLF_104450 [Clonorchis sinensis]|uniref:Integrase catalytic domain-containing protein n=1 Tax=Clonorchis sinensis TaxID=79923 RepID=G7YBQ0_CLOSI|nr:hypothetical protein CLF_104450 [Clonorchis sinensis]
MAVTASASEHAPEPVDTTDHTCFGPIQTTGVEGEAVIMRVSPTGYRSTTMANVLHAQFLTSYRWPYMQQKPTRVGHFTKRLEATLIPKIDAWTVAKTLWIGRWGVTHQLHTNQGYNFESILLGELSNVLNIRETRTTAYHPEDSSMLGRTNRTPKCVLKAFSNHETFERCNVALSRRLLAYRLCYYRDRCRTNPIIQQARGCKYLRICFQRPLLRKILLPGFHAAHTAGSLSRCFYIKSATQFATEKRAIENETKSSLLNLEDPCECFALSGILDTKLEILPKLRMMHTQSTQQPGRKLIENFLRWTSTLRYPSHGRCCE